MYDFDKLYIDRIHSQQFILQITIIGEQTMIIFLILLLIPSINSVSTPVTWQPSILIQTGVADMVSPTNGSVGVAVFWSKFSLVPRVGLSLKAVTEIAATGNLSIRITNVVATIQNVTWVFSNQTNGNFSLISVGYLAVDQSITYVTYFQFQVLESNYAPYPATLNTSHNLSIIGYLTGFSLDSNLLGSVGKVKDLSITVSFWNSTHCRVLLVQHNDTYLVGSAPTVGIVVVDSTISSTFKTHYFDIKPTFTANSSTNATITPSFTYFQSSTFFVGINAFVFQSTQIFKFGFGYTDLVLGSDTAFTTITVGILHTRYRYCPSNIPEFMEVGELCYDICPDRYYAVPAYHYCSACSYSCLTCSNQNTCKTCPTGSNRFLNLTSSTNGIDGSCNCSYYHYDDMVNALCPSCHYSCLTCYLSNLSTNCLSCNTSNNRFMTYLTTVNNQSIPVGQCRCGSGYYDSGMSVCPQCSYTCLTCLNSNTCLTCPPTRVLNNVTGQCDCITGYSDYGSATCSKQQSFKIMSAILYVCFITFMFFMIIDKFKIQYIEGIWILQLCFFCIAILDQESYYHPLRALAPIVNGFNSLSSEEFSTMSSSPGLAALKIKNIFLGNANLMPAMALGIFIMGFITWIINKIICSLPQQLVKISDYFMYDGVFSIALFNTLNLFFSFGAQVDFYISGQELALSSIVLNWIYIVALILLHLWISYQYLVHYKRFTVVNDALKKDSLNIRHPLIMKFVRVVEGFSLGIGYAWEVIPFQVLVIELITVVYLIIKRPYKSKIDVASSIINQVVIFAIIMLMTFQTQATFTTYTSRILMSWIQVGLILLATVKTVVFYYFKTCKHYMSVKFDPIPEIVMNFGQTTYDPDAPNNPTNKVRNERTLQSFYQLDQNSSIQFQEMDIGILRRKGTL